MARTLTVTNGKIRWGKGQYLPMKDVAKKAEVSIPTVWRWIQLGMLKARRTQLEGCGARIVWAVPMKEMSKLRKLKIEGWRNAPSPLRDVRVKK